MADIAPQLKDKRQRGLVMLAGFTLFFVILAMVALTIRANEAMPSMSPRAMFPDLTAQRDAVAKITIATGEGTFDVVRTPEGGWILPGKSNFPAKFDNVKKTIIGLSELKLIQQKTARKDWHQQLDLVSPEDKGAAISITLADAQGKVLAAVLAGKVQDAPTVNATGTIYVRRPGEDQTWLARGFLTLFRTANEWIDNDLFAIERTRIAKAEIAPEGQTPYTLERAQTEPDFKIAGMPADKEPTSSSAVNGVASSLVGMTFDDVAPQSTQDFSKGSRATFTTFDGLTVVVSVVKAAEDKYWATFAASANPAPPPPAPAAGAQPDAAAQAAGATADVLKAEAERINRRTQGWAFNLPKYKGESLTAKIESIIKDKVAAPAPEGAPGTDPTVPPVPQPNP